MENSEEQSAGPTTVDLNEFLRLWALAWTRYCGKKSQSTLDKIFRRRPAQLEWIDYTGTSEELQRTGFYKGVSRQSGRWNYQLSLEPAETATLSEKTEEIQEREVPLESKPGSLKQKKIDEKHLVKNFSPTDKKTTERKMTVKTKRKDVLSPTLTLHHSLADTVSLQVKAPEASDKPIMLQFNITDACTPTSEEGTQPQEWKIINEESKQEESPLTINCPPSSSVFLTSRTTKKTLTAKVEQKLRLTGYVTVRFDKPTRLPPGHGLARTSKGKHQTWVVSIQKVFALCDTILEELDGKDKKNLTGLRGQFGIQKDTDGKIEKVYFNWKGTLSSTITTLGGKAVPHDLTIEDFFDSAPHEENAATEDPKQKLTEKLRKHYSHAMKQDPHYVPESLELSSVPSSPGGRHGIPSESILESLHKSLEDNKHYRVMLSGLAGQGKSSFCRWFVRSVLHEDSEHFSWVWYIDLNNLFDGKKYLSPRADDTPSILTVEKLLPKEFPNVFAAWDFPEEKQVTLARTMLMRGNNLFVVDGFDQIADLRENKPIKDLVNELLGMPYVVITTRPNAIPEHFAADLSVRLGGFAEENRIHEYIDKFFGSTSAPPARVKEVHDLVKNNATFRTLVQIPLLAELICRAIISDPEAPVSKTLKRINSSNNPVAPQPGNETNAPTSGQLYTLMVRCLVSAHTETSSTVSLNHTEILAVLEPLSLYAFNDLQSAQPYFDQKGKEILRELEKGGAHNSRSVLKSAEQNFFLLRVGGKPDASVDQMTYQFPSPEIQTYFAAFHVAGEWLKAAAAAKGEKKTATTAEDVLAQLKSEMKSFIQSLRADPKKTLYCSFIAHQLQRRKPRQSRISNKVALGYFISFLFEGVDNMVTNHKEKKASEEKSSCKTNAPSCLQLQCLEEIPEFFIPADTSAPKENRNISSQLKDLRTTLVETWSLLKKEQKSEAKVSSAYTEFYRALGETSKEFQAIFDFVNAPNSTQGPLEDGSTASKGSTAQKGTRNLKFFRDQPATSPRDSAEVTPPNPSRKIITLPKRILNFTEPPSSNTDQPDHKSSPTTSMV